MVIPSSSIVITCNYAIHRDVKIFERPDEFVPDRWKNSTAAMKLSVMGLSLGRHNCQGQGFALTEFNKLLIKLISKFEFSIMNKGNFQNQIL